MPRVELTYTAGALPDVAKGELAKQLAEAMLRWEGAPDTEFFRSITWVYANEGSGFDGLVVFFERMNDGWRGWTGKRQLVIPGRRPGARGESRRTRSTSGDPHGLHRMDCHHRGDPRPRRGVGRRNS